MLFTLTKKMTKWVVVLMGLFVVMMIGPSWAISETSSALLPGWHWYNEVFEEEGERPSIEIGDFLLALSPEQLKYVPIEGLNLDELPSEALKVLIEAKKVRALDAPDVTVVTEYFIVQKAAFDRARKFTDMWELALYTQPELDFHTTNPVSSAGHTIYNEMEQRSDQEILLAAKDEVGIFFFFTSTCEYCQKQAKILKSFSDTYGWKILPVTIDGKGLPEYPHPRNDNGMGEQLGVSYYPTLLLSIPNQKFLVKVGAGFLTMQNIQRRVIQLLKQQEHIPDHLKYPGVG